MVIIIALIVATTVVLLLSRVANQRKKPSELDLRSVRDAMIEKHGWTEERVDAAQLEYVRFLILLQSKPGFMLVPWLDASGRDDLDQFWHQHILDTEKYAADCKALFGRMIHHNPNVLRGSREEKDAVQKTRRLYTRTFSSGTYGSNADPADFAQHAQLQLRTLALIPMRLTLTTGEMAVKVAIVAEEARAMGVEVMDAEATGVAAATDRM